MIPTKATDTAMTAYVRNIVASYRAATSEQRARGEQWYPVAHDLARLLGEDNVSRGAGILAALSPQKEWTYNVRLAERAVSEGRPSGHFGDSLRKCERIMAGENPELVLPMDFKTGHFYRCILDPTDPDPVCIDRHAHDVAVGKRYGDGDRGLSNKTRYATLALAYRLAARKLGKIPSEVQAVTWCAQVDQWQHNRDHLKEN